MTDVTIISGFLGAGKTTLIKKLLSEVFQGQKVVLLENEYGEVGIDGGFMKDSGIQITELNSGCICCTLAGDFQDAINEIVDKFSPDRLIIEPSGVGKLSDIRRAVETIAKEGRIRLGGSATVVDANKCKMYLKNFGEFFIDQVKCAETVIFSRSQLVSEEKLKTAFDFIKRHYNVINIVCGCLLIVLGILMIGNLINGMFGLAGPVINGLGRSKFMLLMNAVSLVFAIAMNYLLIPHLGIAGAALSSMGYQILQAVWMNIYVYRMIGFWPYRWTLWIQGIWIVLLTVLYVVLNNGFNPSLVVKAVFYGMALLLILGTFFFQGLSGKKPARKR